MKTRLLHGVAGGMLLVLALSSQASHAADDTQPGAVESKRDLRVLDVPRDLRGRIERSHAAKTAFRHANPCPATQKTSGPCPGYVIDHIVALKRGGTDAPENMQWQTREEARLKDRIE